MVVLIMLLPLVFSGIFHMLIVKADLFKFLKIPLSVRLFGANKTYRGFVVMIISTVAGVYLCDLLFPEFIYYKDVNLAVLGVLLGLSYTVFELPNSYMKRRLGIAPGKRSDKYSFIFCIYDQMDSGIGLALVYFFYLGIDISTNLAMIFTGTFIHLFFNFLLYLLKVRKEPF